MSFTAQPTDANGNIMSSAVPDGTNTPIALEAGPSLSSGGNTLAPASVYAKTGNIVDLATLLAHVPANIINVGTPTETAVSVGVTSSTALAANSSAKYRQFINDSPNIIYLSFGGSAAALNTGTRLNANGGSILFDRYVPTGIVKAIATVAGSNLLVTEG